MKLFIALFLALVTQTIADDCNVPKTDVWWGDIRNWMSLSFQACKESCRVDDRCVGVVYYHWGIAKGKCFLKNNNHHRPISCLWCTAAFKPCITQEGPCPAGQFKSARLTCSTCPANTYSSAGASSCTTCAVGHFSDKGATSCTACPTGTYNEERMGNCKLCPADTYNDVPGAAECKPCGEGYVSPAGSTTVDHCEPVNGAHCWVLYDNVRLTGSYGDAMGYDKATAACFGDKDCTGVTCKRRKGKSDLCYLAQGDKHEEARSKWYTSLKEC